MWKVEVSDEEKSLSYYRFYQQEMAEIPEGKKEILKQGCSPIPAVSFDEKDKFLAGEDDDYCQTGYGILEDGTGFVCNTTYMPHVTAEMLDWWFPWHSVGSDLRYKIWDREDHYFARANRVDYVCDPRVPFHQKTWGVSHYIIEDIGLGPDFLKLNFKRPRDFGYEEAILGTEKCQSMVCAIGESECAAAMTHKWYAYKEGVMFCSRFWIGFGTVKGRIVKTLPEGMQIPEALPRKLYSHCIKEFTNLAKILPEVYEENKGTL